MFQIVKNLNLEFLFSGGISSWCPALKHHISRVVGELLHLILFPFIGKSFLFEPVLKSLVADEDSSCFTFPGLFYCSQSVPRFSRCRETHLQAQRGQRPILIHLFCQPGTEEHTVLALSWTDDSIFYWFWKIRLWHTWPPLPVVIEDLAMILVLDYKSELGLYRLVNLPGLRYWASLKTGIIGYK